MISTVGTLIAYNTGSNKSLLGKGLTLHERRFGYRDSDFTDVAAVFEKMLYKRHLRNAVTQPLKMRR